nr:MAG TPA_asm: hypothetical protein [Caudoviricetes sp.]
MSYLTEKEVYYDPYCRMCKHFEFPEDSDECNECLNTPVNENSHKPIHFKEATNE